jgi:Ser/Thr protein kinase RdoA (MazF antagonist)
LFALHKKGIVLQETDQQQIPFQDLGPDVVLDAVESCGYVCDGTFLALNSYENRVYQVGIEADKPLVAKFYRPNRWSSEAIQEEHDFSIELVEREIPVVRPLADANDITLHEFAGYRFALFPRQGGHWPELDNLDNLEWLGRFIGRIHAVGGIKAFKFRRTLDIDEFGEQPYQYLLEHGFIPRELQSTYRNVAEEVLQQVRAAYSKAGEIRNIRLHGDCHLGNVLWTDSGPHFVDLDDCCTGPAVQDMWMFFSGTRQEMALQLSAFLEGYSAFSDFRPTELYLIEALRTLRMIHYSAWLARRWHDPAFPQSFPWFGSYHYWEEQIHSLREQVAQLEQPPLTWYR